MLYVEGFKDKEIKVISSFVEDFEVRVQNGVIQTLGVGTNRRGKGRGYRPTSSG